MTNPVRVINRNELQSLLQEKIQLKSTKEILDAMLNENVPAGKIKDLKEVFEEKNAHSLVRQEVINGISTQRVSSIAFKWE
jgi:crotonobetainyl-CoA:carnitine CoA-transferase CaiB-like acyl-CoA transferase